MAKKKTVKKVLKAESVTVKILRETRLVIENSPTDADMYWEHFNLRSSGKQVSMSAKDHKYVTESYSRFRKAREILKKYYNND